MAKKRSNVIGGWAFLAGVVIAVIFGFLGNLSPNLAYALAVIGIVIGLLNVADEETTPFLMSGAVLIIASALGQNAVGTIPQFGSILDSLLLLFVPATIVVAVKNVFSLARN